VLNGLALDWQKRNVLGEDGEIVVTGARCDHPRIRADRMARELSGYRGMVALVFDQAQSARDASV
jgi:hypothetical protein